MTSPQGPRLAIDIGGTFTDTVLARSDGTVLATAKTATTPAEPALGALEGARIVLGETGTDCTDIQGFVHGTTLATNALIERRGAHVATITNEGFRDILDIGYERRYSQYAIDIEKPDLIVSRDRAFTIGGRIDVAGRELTTLDEDSIPALAHQLESTGIEAAAICLLHAYANPAHELRLAEHLAEHLPDLVISLSHEVSPEAREFDRLSTTIANAYVQPLMSRYLLEFERRFSAEGLACPILMMTAGGGMTTLETAARLPIRLVESGPAGGAVLAARIARSLGEDKVLSFDMGGTTAKLCLIDDFRPQTARRFEIGRAERFIKGSGMPVRIPVIEMIEIGAGGGSIAHIDRLGRLRVGPESAGADPGPAAFAKGGTRPTVTDADVTLGLIEPARFAEGRLTIDTDAARGALNHLASDLSTDTDGAASGVAAIVDENMANAARMHAVESGKDLSERLMIAFGGNGPLHATRVARRAGVTRILIPCDPGVGSAVGFLAAPVSFEIVRSRYETLDTLDPDGLNAFFHAMRTDAEAVVGPGAPGARLSERRTAFMRYRGQGHEIEIQMPSHDIGTADLEGLRAAYEAEYARQFSRKVPGMAIEILNWSLTLSAPVAVGADKRQQPDQSSDESATHPIICDLTGTPCEALLIERTTLAAGKAVDGPALIVEPQTTTVVSQDFQAKADDFGNLWLTRRKDAP